MKGKAYPMPRPKVTMMYLFLENMRKNLPTHQRKRLPGNEPYNFIILCVSQEFNEKIKTKELDMMSSTNKLRFDSSVSWPSKYDVDTARAS